MADAPDRDTPRTVPHLLRAARRRLAGPHGWLARLLPESTRSYVAAGVALLVGVPVRQFWPEPWTTIDGVLASLVAYQLAYVVLTLGAYLRASPTDLERATARTPDAGAVRRWLLVGESGAGAALSVGLGAIVAAVIVLPQSPTLPSAFAPGVLVAICLLLVVTAWGTMVLTYAVDYLHRDAHDPGLRFPGGGERLFMDYLYLSLSVGTSFGTTDVQVTTSALRRTVSGQVLAAFVFNAVIVAAAVSTIATLAS